MINNIHIIHLTQTVSVMYIELVAILLIVAIVFIPKLTHLWRRHNDIDEFDNYDDFIANYAENLPNIDLGTNILSGIRTSPCDRGLGLWVGAKLDTNTNCRVICNSSSAEYSFYDNAAIYVDDEKVKLGGYCGIPLDGQCNLSTTTPIYSHNKWKCLPKYPELGGALGTKIKVCDGKLLDRKTGKQYSNYIPISLHIDDLYEQFQGDYRFVCADRNKIRIGSQPFATVDNYCMKYMPNGKTKAYPDFEAGNCDCEQYGYENIFKDRSLPCTNITSGVHHTLTTKSFKTMAFRISRPCIKANDIAIDENVYPCGVDNFFNTDDAIVGGYILPSNGASPYVEAEL